MEDISHQAPSSLGMFLVNLIFISPKREKSMFGEEKPDGKKVRKKIEESSPKFWVSAKLSGVKKWDKIKCNAGR